MHKTLKALLLGAALLGPCPGAVLAQTTPPAAAATDETRQLADGFMRKLGMDQMMDSIVQGSRQMIITMLQQSGPSEAQAAEIADRYLVPEFRARMPELMARFRDILATDFTADELRAVLNNQSNDARQSAAAKVPQMQADFQKAGQEWGGQVGRDAFAKNRVELEKLGVKGMGQ